MLRPALRSTAHFRPRPATRTFVSTALLTRKWENESVNDLRSEARKRGIPAWGNKATLITRLRHDDERKTVGPDPTPVSTPAQQVRHASVVAEPTAEVPGVPESDSSTPLPTMLLNVELPDLDKPEPEPATPIPFEFDKWDSEQIKAEEAEAAVPEPEVLKVLAVAGDATVSGTGPVHNLYTEPAPAETQPAKPKRQLTGFWADVVEDLNLPTSLPFSAPKAETLYDVAEKTTTSAGPQVNYTRTLDRDERNGVWALLGLLAGSWLLAGYFSAPSAYVEHAKETVVETAEKTKEKAKEVTGKH